MPINWAQIFRCHKSDNSHIINLLHMKNIYNIFLFISILLIISCSTPDDMKLNHIQVLGSHNSYKKAIQPELLQQCMKEDPETFTTLDYFHLDIESQLDLGLRNLEIDVLHDPQGGRYKHPVGNQLLAQFGAAPIPFDEDNEMSAPGFKVLHIQDLDFQTSCYTLQSCLAQIKSWSNKHPNHIPIVITLNAKTDSINRAGFTEPLPFTSAVFDALDLELIQGLGKENIIMPNDVRADYQTLNEAVLAHNWPNLENAKGKFLLALDEIGRKQEQYIKDHPSLDNRVMFVNAPAGTPESAFLVLNEPKELQSEIKQRVKEGYLVRTRADANTLEARQGDLSRFEAAIRSGAHFISTDYYHRSQGYGNDYLVSLPNEAILLCNQINKSKLCKELYK